MMNQYLRSQRGGSLILVLLIIVILSITGTIMLNQTLYSKKTIIANAAVQAEFYGAEGSLDLFLHDLGETQEEIYAYLEDYINAEGLSHNSPYEIGGEEYNVSIVATYHEGTPTQVNNAETKIDTITAVVTAQSVVNPKISRVLKLNANKTTAKTLNKKPVFNPGKSLNYHSSNGDLENDSRIVIPDSSISKYEDKAIFDGPYNFFKQTLINRGKLDKSSDTYHPIMTGYYTEIDPPGSHGNNMYIPKDNIVVVESLRFRGGNNINVKGLLIVKKIDGNANMTFTITSGILVDEVVKGSSSNWTINGVAEGIDCRLLGEAFPIGLCAWVDDPDSNDVEEKVEIFFDHMKISYETRRK